MKLAIVGTRTFNDYELLCKRVNEMQCYGVTEVVSGGAKGADTLAERYAKENGSKLGNYIRVRPRDN